MKSTFILLFIFAFIPLSHASTAYSDTNFTLRTTESSEKNVITFEGLIRMPLADEFQKLINKINLNKPLELRLNSEGGSIVETQKVIKILETLKDKNVELITRVNLGSMCASSCAPIFVQGQRRVAGAASTFMFHGVALYILTNIPSAEDSQIMIDSYEKAGISAKWIQEQKDLKVWSTASETWYNGKELFENDSNFVTEFLSNRITFDPYNKDFSSKPR